MNHLKHGPGNNLIHGPGGHLVHACGSGGGGGCACADPVPCSLCPDATPTQFHVTFTGIVPCGGCVSCAADGASLQLTAGAVNGTYLLSRNGACAWTTYSPTFAASAALYPSVDCSGSSTPVTFSVQQVRVAGNQFRLQITNDTNAMLLFDATFTTTPCCVSYTVSNALAVGCGCSGSSPNIYTLASGGTATVTPC